MEKEGAHVKWSQFVQLDMKAAIPCEYFVGQMWHVTALSPRFLCAASGPARHTPSVAATVGSRNEGLAAAFFVRLMCHVPFRIFIRTCFARSSSLSCLLGAAQCRHSILVKVEKHHTVSALTLPPKGLLSPASTKNKQLQEGQSA
eukprot:4315591-Amphidinium_carterae.1